MQADMTRNETTPASLSDPTDPAALVLLWESRDPGRFTRGYRVERVRPAETANWLSKSCMSWYLASTKGERLPLPRLNPAIRLTPQSERFPRMDAPPSEFCTEIPAPK